MRRLLIALASCLSLQDVWAIKQPNTQSVEFVSLQEALAKAARAEAFIKTLEVQLMAAGPDMEVIAAYKK